LICVDETRAARENNDNSIAVITASDATAVAKNAAVRADPAVRWIVALSVNW